MFVMACFLDKSEIWALLHTFPRVFNYHSVAKRFALQRFHLKKVIPKVIEEVDELD